MLFDRAVQILKYLFTITRYQPRHAFHIGILTYRDSFYIIRYYLDRAFLSQPYKWNDEQTAWSALKDAGSKLDGASFHDEPVCNVASSIQVCYQVRALEPVIELEYSVNVLSFP